MGEREPIVAIARKGSGELLQGTSPDTVSHPLGSIGERSALGLGQLTMTERIASNHQAHPGLAPKVGEVYESGHPEFPSSVLGAD